MDQVPVLYLILDSITESPKIGRSNDRAWEPLVSQTRRLECASEWNRFAFSSCCILKSLCMQEMFRGQKTTLGVSPYLWPCLRDALLLSIAAYGILTSPWAFGNFHVYVAHLAVGALGSHAHVTVQLSWVLGTWIQVFILHSSTLPTNLSLQSSRLF